DPNHPEKPVYTLPRKIYYNTVVTGRLHNSNHPYVGWSSVGAAITKVKYQAAHEVYNNIFLVGDGRPGGRDFYANSGWEIYDGNVYWHYKTGSPWLRLHTSSGIKKGVLDVVLLKSSQAYADSQVYYPPGWENSGLSQDPKLDHTTYKPMAPWCTIGAVDLRKTHWPGTDAYDLFRGAIPVPPVFGMNDGGYDGQATE
ncbi:MAG: hypothetical protein ACM3XO_00285, partial [Bacteroidota bacterium]